MGTVGTLLETLGGSVEILRGLQRCTKDSTGLVTGAL